MPWLLRYGTLARWSSTARRWGIQATHLHADVTFDGPAYLGPGFGVRILDRGSLHFGAGVEFRHNFLFEVAGTGRVTVGARCVFTGMGLIQCTTTVDIGDDVIMGQGLLIADGTHRFRDPDRRFQEQGYDFRPIHIGRGAVGHTNVIITHNVGERAVIGANSVVTRPIPPYCLAVGSPAKVVEYFGPPDRRQELLGPEWSDVGL
jgi:acetyltransferase-like isoleucine patch superfamily enzyme